MQEERLKLSYMQRVVISCVTGSAFEWYDFAVYGFFAATIGKLFFPSEDPFQQIVFSFCAFASGLLARPVGAIIFGYIGDIWGRKKALVVSIYMIAIPTALMGLSPTYEQIGPAAGIILTLVRILQGLGIGGGFTGAIVFLYEHASPEKRSVYSSLGPFSLVVGFIVGAIVATCVDKAFTTQQLESFAWRIPFILSLFGVFIAEYVKRKLKDPRHFLESKTQNPTEKKNLLGNLFRYHWRGLVIVIMIDVLAAIGYSIIAIFFTTYFDFALHLGSHNAFIIQTINMIFFSFFILLGGWMADLIKKRTQMIVSTMLLAILSYPLFIYITQGTFASALLGELIITFLFSMYYSAIPAAICSVFPLKVRLMGVSFAHSFSMAVFGAHAQTLAVCLVKWTGSNSSPSLLLIIPSLISAVALYYMERGGGILISTTI